MRIFVALHHRRLTERRLAALTVWMPTPLASYACLFLRMREMPVENITEELPEAPFVMHARQNAASWQVVAGLVERESGNRRRMGNTRPPSSERWGGGGEV
jgi:hypothetical protein